MNIYSTEFEKHAAEILEVSRADIMNMRTSHYPYYSSRSYHIEIMWKTWLAAKGIILAE